MQDGEYTVIFIDGDKPLVTQVVTGGDKATDPDLSKDGYVIEGWYIEDTLETPWDFGADTVDTNIRLYAKWLIDYKVVADGETDVTSTTKLTITFGEAVSGLAVEDITLSNDSGQATKGTLTGSGTTWTLTVTDVVQGDITFAIAKEGINSNAKTVAVYVASALPPPGDVTFTLEGDSATGTTAITIELSEAVADIVIGELTISDNDGEIVPGVLASVDNIVYTLAVTSVTTAGTVTIAIAKEGITTEGQQVTVSAASSGDVTYTVVADGETDVANTTELTITFDAAVNDLEMSEITLTKGTGEAIKDTLSGSGTTWTLAVTNVVQGNISFAINKNGINPAEKTVAVYTEPSGP